VKSEGGDPEPAWRDRAEAEIVNCADAICVSCIEEEQQFRRLYGDPQGRIEIIAPGVEHAFFAPGDQAGARRALGFDVDGPLLLFVGRLQLDKGLVEFVEVGVDPEIMGIGPVPAVRALLEKAELKLEDIDLWELNEAFAAQVLACNRELGIDGERMNVKGGAIALGHPIGATGCRILVTLLHAMEERGDRRGVATLCVSGGLGAAMLVERIP
ncbi:MAG: hypothetical protein ACC662_02820, partial [Planctomycetota bacterium]